MNLATHLFRSPLGPLFVAVDEDGAVVRLQFAEGLEREQLEEALSRRGYATRRSPKTCAPAIAEVREFLAGDRRRFDVRAAAEGTDFQRTVWDAVSRVPAGRTSTYARIAEEVGRPRAVRAVGRCNATNPVVLIVPCHRIVGSDGRLTGYGGGLENKRFLLELEGAELALGC